MRRVVKRDGKLQPVQLHKVQARIEKLCWNLEGIDVTLVAQKVINGIYDGVSTTELDELAGDSAYFLCTTHPNYGILAGRIAVSNLQKNTHKAFSKVATLLYNYVLVEQDNLPAPLLSKEVYDFIQANADELDAAIVSDRDYLIDYFGFKTLCHSFLLKMDGRIVERPQMMFMRVSCGIHCGNVRAAIETYNFMSQKYFIHASPTLFNAGTPTPQMASCFLLTIQEDSINGIYDTLKQCAQISRLAGGIGLRVSHVRGSGSYIRGTNGWSKGIVNMLRVFNTTNKYVDQAGRRKGATTIYLTPFHPDIRAFLDLKKNIGMDEVRARDMFYALWIPDLFMERVEADEDWCLFCPNSAPQLYDCYGEEFKQLYIDLETNRPKLIREKMKARVLWKAIIESQIETGGPFMLFADACNAKSNQKNLGYIGCSNLCTEIIEYCSPDEVAVCNLASVAVNEFVTKDGAFDFDMLVQVVRVMTRNLNKVIDRNLYPLEQARRSNLRHRPIGIGVQGLADLFILLRLPYESKEAGQLDVDIFEAIYYAACSESCQLAMEEGAYETFPGSPMSQGLFQFDLWNTKPTSQRFDWDALRQQIVKHGIRNSLLLAPMPTVSTSAVLGNTEMTDPVTSNMFARRTLAGEFLCINKHLLKDLIGRNLWCDELKNQIIANKGSVQGIDAIPNDLQQLYKTIWEIPLSLIIDRAASRGAFICQSQSLSFHVEHPDFTRMTRAHFYAWKKGLKTGMYYLRSKAAVDAIQFTVDQQQLVASNNKKRGRQTTDNNVKTEKKQCHFKSHFEEAKKEEIQQRRDLKEEKQDETQQQRLKRQQDLEEETSSKMENSVCSELHKQKHMWNTVTEEESDLTLLGLLPKKLESVVCSLSNPGACMSCSS